MLGTKDFQYIRLGQTDTDWIQIFRRVGETLTENSVGPPGVDIHNIPIMSKFELVSSKNYDIVNAKVPLLYFAETTMYVVCSNANAIATLAMLKEFIYPTS